MAKRPKRNPTVSVSSPLSTCIELEGDLTVTGTSAGCHIVEVTVNQVTMRATLYSNGDWDAGPFSVNAGTPAQCAAHQAAAQNRVDAKGTNFGIDGEPDLFAFHGRDFWVHRPTKMTGKAKKKK